MRQAVYSALWFALLPASEAFSWAPARTATTSRYQTRISARISPMVSQATTKPYDLVLFGATSYVGALAAEYILTTYGASPPTFKWAIAARSQAKLEALKTRLAEEIQPEASGLPVIVADSTDDVSLDRMVGQTKVIITAVGPYQLYGSKLVAACARAGVHHCDLTGESLWVKDMIDEHHEEAERTGAKIVPSCGFDSIPADLGTFMMMEHMKRTHGAQATDVRHILRDSSGGVSGGTCASALSVADLLWKGGKRTLKKLKDPYLLAPGSARSERVPKSGGFGYDSVAGVWTAPSPFADHDLKIITLSAALLGYAPFRYKQVLGIKGVHGPLASAMVTVGLALVGLLFYLPPTRAVMKNFLPAPGQGPTKKRRDEGYFWIDYFAKANIDGKEITTRGVVGSSHGDGGYKETAKMFVETGLCLILDEDKLPSKKGGVLTVASAMGAPVLDRLRRARMTFKVLDE